MGGRRIVLGSIVASLVALALCPPAMAQQVKSRQDLLKSIGLSRPAITTAPEFALRDVRGGLSSLAQYRGGLILLNFWATWCAPCRDEMPSMEQLSRNLGGQGLAVVAINQRESAALVSRFMTSQGLTFSAPLDTDGRVAASYRVYGIPVTYLLDGVGQAIGMKSGPLDWASPAVVDTFRKLIGEGGRSVSAGSMDLEPRTSLPSSLRAKAEGVLIRGQQDAQAEGPRQTGSRRGGRAAWQGLRRGGILVYGEDESRCRRLASRQRSGGAGQSEMTARQSSQLTQSLQ